MNNALILIALEQKDHFQRFQCYLIAILLMLNDFDNL